MNKRVRGKRGDNGAVFKNNWTGYLSQFNKIWIISDTHFNHQFMIDKKIRIPSYEDRIINSWATLVGEKDLVIHTGDVIMNRQSNLRSILTRLPGTKLLVRGNHDKNKAIWYRNNGFDFVCDKLTLQSPVNNIIFTHKPMRVSTGSINVFGHLHRFMEDQHHRESILDMNENSRCFSLEYNDYRPVSLDWFLLNSGLEIQHYLATTTPWDYIKCWVRRHILNKKKPYASGRVSSKAEPRDIFLTLM